MDILNYKQVYFNITHYHYRVYSLYLSFLPTNKKLFQYKATNRLQNYVNFSFHESKHLIVIKPVLHFYTVYRKI